MCITTQMPAPHPTLATPKLDRITTTTCCPNEACQSIQSKESSKRVTFQEQDEIAETICISDLSQDEKDAMWLTDQDWDEMRRDFFTAKRKKCPTVEMAQPYRVSDRKASIRYARLVVKREESKFLKSLQQFQEAQSTDSTETKPPCFNCFLEKVSELYAGATRRSRDEAYQAGKRYELLAKAQEIVVEAKPAAATPVVSPATSTNKRKLVPTIPVPAC